MDSFTSLFSLTLAKYFFFVYFLFDLLQVGGSLQPRTFVNVAADENAFE